MIYAENIFVCIAVPLLISLLFVRHEVRHFLAAFLCGMGACLISAYISGFLNLVTGMSENDTAVFLSPVIEELMKMLVLLFFLAVFRLKERTSIMLAVAVGAGFATFENCCYLLTAGTGSLSFVVIRGLVVGVMHIVSILALTVWLIAARRLNAFSFPAVVGGLSLSMTFHALYNLLVSQPGPSTWIGYAMPPVAALLMFLLHQRMPAGRGEGSAEKENISV